MKSRVQIHPPLRMKRANPGSWAQKVAPRWCFTLFDAAERLGCSVRHARRLVSKHRIQTGLITRPVRLPDNRIVWRKLATLTPSALERLLLAHSGFTPNDTRHRRTPQ